MSSPPVPAGARALVPKRGGGGGGPSSIRTATLVVSGRARRSGSSAAAMADSPGGGAPAEKGEKHGGSGGERDKCSVAYMCGVEFYGTQEDLCVVFLQYSAGVEQCCQIIFVKMREKIVKMHEKMCELKISNFLLHFWTFQRGYTNKSSKICLENVKI